MIVSVNPYLVLDQMGERLIPDYQHNKAKETLAPHLYALAQQSFTVRPFALSSFPDPPQNMLSTGQAQSVVISGESGSGKTEATKIILKFLTVASASSGADGLALLFSPFILTDPFQRSPPVFSPPTLSLKLLEMPRPCATKIPLALAN